MFPPVAKERPMAETMTARVDAKGRVAIPQRIRKDLNIQAGDTLFVAYDEEERIVHYAKAENPFDILLTHAMEEDRAGRTVSLREFAAANDIALDGD
jgi:AbrB family looped-hinge helix DNA binding protein